MELRFTHFPYCLHQLADGRYIILNRKYKPLGDQTDQWATYETHPSVVSIKITPATAAKMSWKNSDNVQVIHLYNDGCIPTSGAEHMKAYCKRLAILMEISSKPD